jgi:hypothetical protein
MPNSEDQPSTEATSAPDLDDIAACSMTLISMTRLRCWGSKLKSDRQCSHCKVVLKKLPVRPLLHQLALIAANRRDEQKKTLDSCGIEVSNLRRRTCNGDSGLAMGAKFTLNYLHDGQLPDVEEVKCICAFSQSRHVDRGGIRSPRKV